MNQKELKTETREEMVGVLTAISIVTKRMARRMQEEDAHMKGDNEHESNEKSARSR